MQWKYGWQYLSHGDSVRIPRGMCLKQYRVRHTAKAHWGGLFHHYGTSVFSKMATKIIDSVPQNFLQWDRHSLLLPTIAQSGRFPLAETSSDSQTMRIQPKMPLSFWVKVVQEHTQCLALTHAHCLVFCALSLREAAAILWGNPVHRSQLLVSAKDSANSPQQTWENKPQIIPAIGRLYFFHLRLHTWSRDEWSSWVPFASSPVEIVTGQERYCDKMLYRKRELIQLIF